MPKSANKSAARGRAKRHASSHPYPPRGGGAQKQSLSYAQTVAHKSYFRLSHRKEKGAPVLCVSLCDVIGQLYGPARQDGFKSDSIPFTLASSSPSLAGLGQILPKLQGLARIATRFQVKSASLHYQPMCAADTKGKVGVAIVPGLQGPLSSDVEMASFEHSSVGPLWMPAGTSEYKNRESRWFFCDGAPTRVEIDNSIIDVPENVPFSMVRFIQADTNPDSGLCWLYLEIEFIDLRPAAQSAVALAHGIPVNGVQTLTGAGGDGNWIQWARNEMMEGLFEWGPDLVTNYFSSATPTVPSPIAPGATISVDGGVDIDAWLDLVLGAVTAQPANSAPSKLHEWPLSQFEEVKSQDLVYPSKWSAPVRRRILCKFRSVAEARAARLAGFNPTEESFTAPNAAGDVTVVLYFQPLEPYAVLETLYSEIISAGTGALNQQLEHTFSTTQPGILGWLARPTGTELRPVTSTTAMSVDVKQLS